MDNKNYDNYITAPNLLEKENNFYPTNPTNLAKNSKNIDQKKEINNLSHSKNNQQQSKQINNPKELFNNSNNQTQKNVNVGSSNNKIEIDKMKVVAPEVKDNSVGYSNLNNYNNYNQIDNLDKKSIQNGKIDN